MTGFATDQEILIAVADDGSGIAEEDLEKIFEPLFTNKIKGTGLGLAIVANIVARHMGTLAVEPQGRGDDVHPAFAAPEGWLGAGPGDVKR